MNEICYEPGERSGGIIFKFSNCFRIVEDGQIDVLEVILQGIQHVKVL